MPKIFKKFEKNCKIVKFAFLASGCSSVASHGREGGGGVNRGLIGGHHWGGGH